MLARMIEDEDFEWEQLGGDAAEVGATIDAVARLDALVEQRRRSAVMVAAQRHSPLRGL